MRKIIAFCLVLGAINAQAQSFRDCADCPVMVPLEAGSFQMGESGRLNALPVHTVMLSAFAIGKYEVTQGEWRALMGSNPSKALSCGDTCPVENLSWHDAQAFVERLAAKTGQPYRLPTEAEWEYACRAGERHDFCGGDDRDKVAWQGDEYGSTHPVGSRQPNAWGLHDMSGNVWEWTQDCMHPNYQGAPADGSAWTEPDCKSRVLRGGSWLSGPQYSRSALRFGFSAKYRAGDFGFRVVRPLK